jgi:centromere-localized protein 2
MAPSESDLLRNYLLIPAPLPDIMSVQQFANLFPKNLRASPQVRRLYRELQDQRRATIDAVAANIEREQERSRSIRREVKRAKKEAKNEDEDVEVDIEHAVSAKLYLQPCALTY